MNISTEIKSFAVFVAILILAPACFAAQSNEMSAVSAAESFLQLIDAGNYAESWDATSSFFKQQVSKQQWVKQLENIRPAFGALVKREIKNKNYTKSLTGAPDGEYVVIQFSTSFTNKRSAIETVTPMLESDGEWRVAGYYIQ